MTKSIEEIGYNEVKERDFTRATIYMTIISLVYLINGKNKWPWGTTKKEFRLES